MWRAGLAPAGGRGDTEAGGQKPARPAAEWRGAPWGRGPAAAQGSAEARDAVRVCGRHIWVLKKDFYPRESGSRVSFRTALRLWRPPPPWGGGRSPRRASCRRGVSRGVCGLQRRTFVSRAGTRGALPISGVGKNLSFSFTKSFFFWLRIAYFSPFRLKFVVL